MDAKSTLRFNAQPLYKRSQKIKNFHIKKLLQDNVCDSPYIPCFLIAYAFCTQQFVLPVNPLPLICFSHPSPLVTTSLFSLCVNLFRFAFMFICIFISKNIFIYLFDCFVAAYRIFHCGNQALQCGSQAQLPCSMWDFSSSTRD